MRALGSGELRATRDNLGRWSIDPAVLDDWASMRRTPVRHQPGGHVDTPAPTPMATLDTLRPELEQMRAERDASRLEAAALRTEAAQLREETLFYEQP